MIDSHCHLADEAFAGDLEAVVQRARAAGITAALCVVDAGSPDEQARAVAVAAAWPAVRFCVGIHPHQAGQYAGRVHEVPELVEAGLGCGAVRAVGEIGLDFHYDFSPADVQRDVLGVQVEDAARRGLPVVIHAREAEAEVIDALRRHGRGAVRGVFHCYTGDLATARRVLDLGFLIGIGGIVTFPRGQNVRDLVAHVPLDRLLIETDSPFLAPVPYRGTRNEPAWVTRVAEAVGELVGLPPATVAERTTANFEALFGP